MKPKVCLKNAMENLPPTAEVKNLMESEIEINPNQIRYETKIISLFNEENE